MGLGTTLATSILLDFCTCTPINCGGPSLRGDGGSGAASLDLAIPVGSGLSGVLAAEEAAAARQGGDAARRGSGVAAERAATRRDDACTAAGGSRRRDARSGELVPPALVAPGEQRLQRRRAGVVGERRWQHDGDGGARLTDGGDRHAAGDGQRRRAGAGCGRGERNTRGGSGWRWCEAEVLELVAA